MDYTEMLFAFQMQEHVRQQLHAKLLPGRSALVNEQFINDNFEGYLIEALENVERTAQMIKNIKHK